MATSIRLAPDIEQRLDYLASHIERTKAYYLREIIEQGIEDGGLLPCCRCAGACPQGAGTGAFRR